MKIQWLSHSCFKITTDTHCLLVDPFLTGNPVAPRTWQQAAEGVTHILLTHGHDDHVGDTMAIAGKTGAHIIGMVELMHYLEEDGATNLEMMNFGGTLDLGIGHSVKMVPAFHSTGAGPGARYTGMPAGYVIRVPGHTIYHAGDTSLFSDMELIDALEQPTIGMLPIGGRFTMDAHDAAYAVENFFHFQHIFPMHYATFPLLAPNADEFVSLLPGHTVHVLGAGESMDF